MVVAGTAGERVQSAATLVMPRRACRRTLFHAEERQPGHAGFGILPFGNLHEPQAHRVHGDGKPGRGDWWSVRMAGRNCKPTEHWQRAGEETLLMVDSRNGANPPRGRLVPLPLRREANPKRAALAAIGAWLEGNPVLPAEAWEAVLATGTRGTPRGIHGRARNRAAPRVLNRRHASAVMALYFPPRPQAGREEGFYEFCC